VTEACQLGLFGGSEDEDRFARLARLMSASYKLLDDAIGQEVTSQRRDLAGIAILFSGGNDSLVLADLFRGRASHVIHCNTGIGVEQTHQFVRDMAATWKLPLLEPKAEGNDSYETLVMGECRAQGGPRKGTVLWSGGFPGPGAHGRMFQRLKERGLERARNLIVGNPRERRVIFLAGRRRHESARRNARFAIGELAPIERKGSIVYVSPLLDWSKTDLNTYRMLHRPPSNEVADLMHQSCECECGSFAHQYELDELDGWDSTRPCADRIRRLQKQVAGTGKFHPRVCQWGWGWNEERPPMRSILCAACDAPPLFELEAS